jgi:hypothetical protein
VVVAGCRGGSALEEEHVRSAPVEETVGAPTTSADVDATPPAEEVIPAIGVDRLFEDLPPRDVPDAKGTIFDSRDQRISARGVVVPVGTPITPVAIDAAGESAVDFVVKEVDRDGEALATLWDGRVPPGSSGDPVSLRRELSGFFLVEARVADRQNGSAWREWVVTVEPEAAAALVASREVTTSGAPVDLRIENRGSVTLEFGVGLRVQRWDEDSWEGVESGAAGKSSELFMVRPGESHALGELALPSAQGTYRVTKKPRSNYLLIRGVCITLPVWGRWSKG